MNVALIGASGHAGSLILKELSDSGQRVTALARHPENIAELLGATAKKRDVLDQAGLAALTSGHDAVISAVRFTASDPGTLIAAMQESGVKRYLVFSGAEPGGRPRHSTNRCARTSDAYRGEARGGAAFLNLLRTIDDLDWTFLSPSAKFVAGEQTWTLRLGNDQLGTNDSDSGISFEDYAVALVDVLENPAHVRKHFTVGY